MLNHYTSQQTNLLRVLRSRFGKTAVIYPAALLVAMGMGCNMLGLVFYARERYGASPSQIGYLAGCWSISYMVGCLFLRPLSRRLLPRFSILGASALMAVTVWCMLMTRALGWLFVLQCCLGLVASFFWPPLMGWLSANVEGGQLNRAMGWFNISWSTGTIISPLMAGRLSEMAVDLPLRAAGMCFFAASCLILGAVLTLSSLADDDHVHTAEKSASRAEDSGTPLRFPAWAGIFTSYLVLSVMLNVFPLVARQELEFSKTLIGFLLFLRALVGTMSLGILGKTSWWHFKGRPMVVGMCLCSGLVLGLVWTRSALAIALLLILMAIFFAQSYSSSLFHGVSGSIRRASRMAIHESLLSAGLFVGSCLGGLIYENSGMVALYSCCAAALLACAIVQAVLSAGKKA